MIFSEISRISEGRAQVSIKLVMNLEKKGVPRFSFFGIIAQLKLLFSKHSSSEFMPQEAHGVHLDAFCLRMSHAKLLFWVPGLGQRSKF